MVFIKYIYKVFMALTVHTSKKCLKGQSQEKVYEFLTWDGSFSLN
jgi:hypothetical protein